MNSNYTFRPFYEEVLRPFVRGCELIMLTSALLNLISRMSYSGLDFMVIAISLGILVSLSWAIVEFFLFYRRNQRYQQALKAAGQPNVFEFSVLSVMTMIFGVTIMSCFGLPIRWPNEQIMATVSDFKLLVSLGILVLCVFTFYRSTRLFSKLPLPTKQGYPGEANRLKRNKMPFVYVMDFILFAVSLGLLMAFSAIALSNHAAQDWNLDQTQAFIILAVAGLILAGQLITTFVKKPVQAVA